MTSSSTYSWGLDNAGILIEAFDRCRVRAPALTRHHMISGITSLNLELLSWSNKGVQLYNVLPFTIQIVENQASYTQGTGVTNIPANTVSMLDVYISQINGGGTGINIDRILTPISRNIYDQYSNKLQPGVPSQYWFQKTPVRTFTLYQPPLQGYPTYQVSGHLLSRVQDANLGGGETPDVDALALDALCAGLAKRLAGKFVDDAELRAEIKADATEAWKLFMETNREDADITILPADSYWRAGGD